VDQKPGLRQIAVGQALLCSQPAVGEQVSCVQSLLSSHAESFAVISHSASVLLQVTVAHDEASPQSRAVPLHEPLLHVSFTVQNWLSLHGAVLLTCVHEPLAQMSFVQTLLSVEHVVPSGRNSLPGHDADPPVQFSA
jgi:hypothetical protein